LIIECRHSFGLPLLWINKIIILQPIVVPSTASMFVIDEMVGQGDKVMAGGILFQNRPFCDIYYAQPKVLKLHKALLIVTKRTDGGGGGGGGGIKTGLNMSTDIFQQRKDHEGGKIHNRLKSNVLQQHLDVSVNNARRKTSALQYVSVHHYQGDPFVSPPITQSLLVGVVNGWL